MKNIWEIFRTDLRRITGNVVASVVIIGLCMIPSLYAWFNILSNWDPYGNASTSNLSIAVYSKDQGTGLLDFSINVGDRLISELRANRDIGWEFPDSEEEAMEGVYSGKYYAALIVPETFSEELISFVNGTPTAPAIQYYSNSKKNAVATKITSKVKISVQRKINAAFLETITLYSSEAADSALGSGGFASGAADLTLKSLKSLDAKLDSLLSVADAIRLMNDSAAGLLDTALALNPDLENLKKAGGAAANSMQSGLDAGTNSMSAVARMTDASLDALIAEMDVLYDQAGLISSGTDVSTITDTLDELRSGGLFTATQELLAALEDTPAALTEAYQEAAAQYQALLARIEEMREIASAAKADADGLGALLQSHIADCRAGLTELKSLFDNTIAPDLLNVTGEASAALSQAQALLGDSDTDLADLTRSIESYRKTLEEGTASLDETRASILQMKEDLDRLTNRLEGLSTSKAYQELMNLLESDSVTLADFISSPVSVREEVFYEIGHFGSEMAPFYTILGIWAGGLIMTALIRVKVTEEADNRDCRPWQKFFGRYLTYFIIGQVQALITVLGDLLFIRIDCRHPVWFVLTGLIAAFVFSLLMYSLTAAFRAVGQALIIVILVIQVAGAGGTFPIEMLPEAYKAVYRFLPFNYGINAMRECVGGIYGNAYLTDIGRLLIFAGVGLVIGLVMMQPFEKLGAMVDRSKEKSGIML